MGLTAGRPHQTTPARTRAAGSFPEGHCRPGSLGRAPRRAATVLRAGGTTLRERPSEAPRHRAGHGRAAADRAKLERGLLPRPLLGDGDVTWGSWSRSGGSLLLGGDFFDALELADGTVRMVIGDVSGHGADQAAVAVALRIAWRSLVLAGVGEDRLLGQLQAVLRAERDDPGLFVTLCDATVAPGRRRLSLQVAGHPPPLLLRPELRPVPLAGWGPPLGVTDRATWPTVEAPLPPGWALLFYTDGIIEGRQAPGSADRWGVDGLRRALQGSSWPAGGLSALADALIAPAEEANGGPLADDVALVLVAEAR